MQKKFLRVLLSFALAALIAVGALTGCKDNNTDNINTGDTSEIPAVDIGEGEISFRFEVMHHIESTTVWTVHTDEATVGAALYAAGLTDNDSFVNVVNEIRANYNEDGYWWAFYINGEMAPTGIGETAIDKDKIYAFVCTKA